jgi:hypothetical protein
MYYLFYVHIVVCRTNANQWVCSVTQEDNSATCPAGGFVLALKMFTLNSLYFHDSALTAESEHISH